MVLHNSDGSVAEISGNGIRCLAQAVLRSQHRSAGSLRIETAAGLRGARRDTDRGPATLLVTVDMGEVSDGPPVPRPVVEWGALDVASLSIGNPHLVLHLDDADSLDPAVDGPAIESLVPGGINVHFLSTEGADVIRLTHWERGAGVTEACGSGATVAAVAANRWGLVGDRVVVRMPGGDATVDVADRVHLTGPSTYVGEVVVP